MKNINLNKQPMELYKILKFESLVSSGGEAKMVINDGQVRVNSQVETQKRKKIMAGDIIEFNDEEFHITCISEGKPESSDESNADEID